MLPTEQAQFFDIVSKALGAYARFPAEQELAAWWNECRTLTIEALQTGLKAHKEDPDRGDRAPRPADITRRMKVGKRDAKRCVAADGSGQCEYPGIFSDGTTGEGPWYCPWHREDRAGLDASRWIGISRDVPYADAMAKRMARMHTEATHAHGVVLTAHAIAKRHGNRAWHDGYPLPTTMQHLREPGADESEAA